MPTSVSPQNNGLRISDCVTVRRVAYPLEKAGSYRGVFRICFIHRKTRTNLGRVKLAARLACGKRPYDRQWRDNELVNSSPRKLPSPVGNRAGGTAQMTTRLAPPASWKRI